MRSRLVWVTRTIVALLSYLLASAPAGKLLFFGNMFVDAVNAWVFSKSGAIVAILVATYIAIEILSHFRDKNKTIENQCHNVCRHIYGQIEQDIGSEFAHNMRVTVFKAQKPGTENVYLKAVNRFQKKEPNTKTRITFKPGEGVVGQCFQLQALTLADDLPEWNEAHKEEYYLASLRYGMGKELVDQLNVKSRVILGIPIKFFITGKSWGVLVLDSTKRDDKFNNQFARKIEGIVEHYAVLFTEEYKS